jgi:hypothetical protein
VHDFMEPKPAPLDVFLSVLLEQEERGLPPLAQSSNSSNYDFMFRASDEIALFEAEMIDVDISER